MTDGTARTDETTGGCQCGAVRYALTTEPTDLSLCHCRMCQKASGGPYMVFGRVPLDSLTWTRGSLSVFASSDLVNRGFCSNCGTPLTFRWRSDAISITLGSLDDPGPFAPTERVGAEAVLPWSEHIAGLSPRPTELGAAALVNHQHPDHDT